MVSVVVMPVPRVMSVPASVSSRAVEVFELCASAGLVLDAHQRLVLEGGLGVRDDGRWAAFEVGVNEPRQNGKGGILEGRELAGLFLFGERTIIHSAHEFATSLEAFRRLLELIEDTPDLEREVKRVSRSHGDEGIELKTGQRIRYRTRTKSGGRGLTGDVVVLDEAMDLPAAIIAALVPTMSARSVEGNPQLWYAGSAVDRVAHEHGVHFAKIRARGITGVDPSLAYFEWSAGVGEPAADNPELLSPEMLADPARWAEANPALGVRISVEHVGNEHRLMGSREFAVERLGVGDWPAVDGSADAPMRLEDWVAVEDQKSFALDPVCLAFDVRPDRSWASVGAAGFRPDGLVHLELIEHRRGTGWVADRIAELSETHRPMAVVANGEKDPLVAELRRAGVDVYALSAGEYAQACGGIFDLVDQQRCRHVGQPELAAAVKGAAKRQLENAWAWSWRGASADLAPLISVTCAAFGLVTFDLQPAEIMIGYA